MHDQVVELAERGKKLAPEDRSRLVDMLLVPRPRNIDT